MREFAAISGGLLLYLCYAPTKGGKHLFFKNILQ